MGSWPGHALPGGFFILYSIWWMVQFTFEKIALNGGRLQPTGRILRRLHRWPIEGASILLAGIIGFIAEMMHPAPKWTLIGTDGQFKNSVEWQHCTIYAFFSVYGFVVTIAKIGLPEAEHYTKMFGSLAFFIEGMIFYFHTHGRTELDVHLHVLLVIAIAFCTVFSAAEVWFPQDDRIRVMRFTATLLQGTWFFMVGTILYWPPSGEAWSDDRANIMFVTVAFAWHLLFDIIVMVAVYGVVRLILKLTSVGAVLYHPMNSGIHADEIEFEHVETTMLIKNGQPAKAGSDVDSE